MIKETTDIIVTWPDNCDYPLWRRFIAMNRKEFKDVIIVLMKTNNGFDYSDFIKEQMKDCTVVKSPKIEYMQDWRNVAVNYALQLSKAQRVWFTEQDFIIHEGFWNEVNKQILEGCQVISVYDQYRMHPCCIFAEKRIIMQTRKDFSIVPDTSDHFALFQEDIDEMFYNDQIIIGTVDCHFEHLNGLSSNFVQIANGGLPNYQPKRFKEYIQDSLKSGMVMHQEYIKVCEEYLAK
jgi:hypothetical protein